MNTVAGAGTLSFDATLTVTRFGFGAMRLTGPGIIGPPADRDECRRVLRRAVDLGIDFIDTADSYGPNVSEEIIADALYPYPSQVVIATKADSNGPGRTSGRRTGRRRICVRSARAA